MPKDFEVSVLLDFYGGLLPEKQRLLVELYYNDDLSLSEIAENEGITRQGVRDSINRAKQQLYMYEDVLHLADTTQKLRRAARDGTREEIIKLIDEL